MLPETYYHRQLSILPPDKATTPIILIGAGGVGSTTALALAKTGFSDLTVFDPDKVEAHNLPSQLYIPAQVNMPKVIALNHAINHFTTNNITAKAELWNGDTAPIMICAVDSMATRKEIYEALKSQYGVFFYVEARMGAELMRIYAGQPADPDFQKRYEKTLYSDDEANPAPCTARAIAYNTLVIGGIIASLVKHYAVGEPTPFEIIFNLANYNYLKI